MSRIIHVHPSSFGGYAWQSLNCNDSIESSEPFPYFIFVFFAFPLSNIGSGGEAKGFLGLTLLRRTKDMSKICGSWL